ncbi:MAG TPA: hypothetical protein VM487_09650, partial [Phycisphaerae bacterium]|nr:hypothetical protein [Phycisphaerae bacterium]
MTTPFRPFDFFPKKKRPYEDVVEQTAQEHGLPSPLTSLRQPKTLADYLALAAYERPTQWNPEDLPSQMPVTPGRTEGIVTPSPFRSDDEVLASRAAADDAERTAILKRKLDAQLGNREVEYNDPRAQMPDLVANAPTSTTGGEVYPALDLSPQRFAQLEAVTGQRYARVLAEQAAKDGEANSRLRTELLTPWLRRMNVPAGRAEVDFNPVEVGLREAAGLPLDRAQSLAVARRQQEARGEPVDRPEATFGQGFYQGAAEWLPGLPNPDYAQMPKYSEGAGALAGFLVGQAFLGHRFDLGLWSSVERGMAKREMFPAISKVSSAPAAERYWQGLGGAWEGAGPAWQSAGARAPTSAKRLGAAVRGALRGPGVGREALAQMVKQDAIMGFATQAIKGTEGIVSGEQSPNEVAVQLAMQPLMVGFVGVDAAVLLGKGAARALGSNLARDLALSSVSDLATRNAAGLLTYGTGAALTYAATPDEATPGQRAIMAGAGGLSALGLRHVGGTFKDAWNDPGLREIEIRRGLSPRDIPSRAKADPVGEAALEAEYARRDRNSFPREGDNEVTDLAVKYAPAVLPVVGATATDDETTRKLMYGAAGVLALGALRPEISSAQMLEDYRGGMTLAGIGEKYGMAAPSVYKRLSALPEYEARSRTGAEPVVGDRKTPRLRGGRIDDDVALRMYVENGKTMQEIADHFGVAPPSVL